MAILHHGTTQHRAEKILALGPDPDYRETPGGLRADGFSTDLESGPFLFGPPADDAHAKAALFPDERGPAILTVDVPDHIIALATDAVYFPMSQGQGIVQSDEGAALEEIGAAGPALSKSILSVE